MKQHSSRSLRTTLFNELDLLRKGKSEPGRANSVARLSACIIETIRLDVELTKLARNVKLIEG